MPHWTGTTELGGRPRLECTARVCRCLLVCFSLPATAQPSFRAALASGRDTRRPLRARWRPTFQLTHPRRASGAKVVCDSRRSRASDLCHPLARHHSETRPPLLSCVVYSWIGTGVMGSSMCGASLRKRALLAPRDVRSSWPCARSAPAALSAFCPRGQLPLVIWDAHTARVCDPFEAYHKRFVSRRRPHPRCWLQMHRLQPHRLQSRRARRQGTDATPILITLPHSYASPCV